jgi:hypothetical protein
MIARYDAANRERHPAAMHDLDDAGAEKRSVTREECLGQCACPHR